MTGNDSRPLLPVLTPFARLCGTEAVAAFSMEGRSKLRSG